MEPSQELPETDDNVKETGGDTGEEEAPPENEQKNVEQVEAQETSKSAVDAQGQNAEQLAPEEEPASVPPLLPFVDVTERRFTNYIETLGERNPREENLVEILHEFRWFFLKNAFCESHLGFELEWEYGTDHGFGGDSNFDRWEKLAKKWIEACGEPSEETLVSQNLKYLFRLLLIHPVQKPSERFLELLEDCCRNAAKLSLKSELKNGAFLSDLLCEVLKFLSIHGTTSLSYPDFNLAVSSNLSVPPFQLRLKNSDGKPCFPFDDDNLIVEYISKACEEKGCEYEGYHVEYLLHLLTKRSSTYKTLFQVIRVSAHPNIPERTHDRIRNSYFYVSDESITGDITSDLLVPLANCLSSLPFDSTHFLKGCENFQNIFSLRRPRFKRIAAKDWAAAGMDAIVRKLAWRVVENVEIGRTFDIVRDFGDFAEFDSSPFFEVVTDNIVKVIENGWELFTEDRFWNIIAIDSLIKLLRRTLYPQNPHEMELFKKFWIESFGGDI